MAEARNDLPPDPPPKSERQRQGWLSKIAPGVRKLVTPKRETPDNLWIKCPDTGEMLYRPDLEAACWVTPSGHHMRLTPEMRFRFTFDGGLWETIAVPDAPDDPLQFVEDRAYKDRLAKARKDIGTRDTGAIAYGRISGVPAVAYAHNFAFMAASLGTAAGEAFVKAAREAVARKAPLVVFTAGGGARMQEGALSLMQMARTTLAVQEVKQAGLPYVVVLTDPTTGGIAASYAMLGDVHLAEPGALIGFAGARVIEQTIRETLPAGFQRAEFLVEKGMVDRVVERKELPEVLGSVLGTLMMGRQRLLAAE